MIPHFTYSDGQDFDFNRIGNRFKAYCPSRVGSCVQQWPGVFRFNLKKDDRSSLDGNRADTPNRSVIAGYGPTSRAAPGATVWMEFSYLLESDFLKSWFLNIAQWQASFDPGEYHTPPLGLTVEHESTIKPIPNFNVRLSTAPGANTAGVVVSPILIGSAPSKLGRVHSVRVEFKDGLGGPGFVKVWHDGVQIVDYAGLTGFDNKAGVYPSWGLYRNNVDQELTGYIFSPDYGTL